MASVWVGEDTLLARRVAVKTLHPELSVDDALRTRFRNEAVSAASVAHPGIVATYDTGDDDGVAFIVMELVDGPNLRTLLDQRGNLAPVDAMRIARGVAVALDQAHRNGIVHRDVKPANVLVPSEGPVKVTDFGIAKADTMGDLTRTGTIVGTARYLAPEQVSGGKTDPRSDIYAVGLLMHEMLTGSLPFHGDSEMATALARLSAPPDPLPDGVPRALASIVAKCLAVDPDARYPSAQALAEALDAVAGGRDQPGAAAPAPARRAPAPKPKAPREAKVARPRRAAAPASRRRSSWPFALLGASLLVAGAAGGFYLFSGVAGDGNGVRDSDGVEPEIAAVADFDPEGDDTENSDDVNLAIDGNGNTSWRTETYESADFGGLDKRGVGLRIDLAETADVSFVEVDAADSGWSVEIYVAEAAADDLAGWGSPVATAEDLSTSERFDIDPPASGAAVLVWITRLPSAGRLSISEIRVG